MTSGWYWEQHSLGFKLFLLDHLLLAGLCTLSSWGRVSPKQIVRIIQNIVLFLMLFQLQLATLTRQTLVYYNSTIIKKEYKKFPQRKRLCLIYLCILNTETATVEDSELSGHSVSADQTQETGWYWTYSLHSYFSLVWSL